MARRKQLKLMEAAPHPGPLPAGEGETRAASEEAGQLSLLTPEEESALFLPVEELRKRYTAGQAEKMEWRRNAAVRMLAYGIPAEHIARDLHMNLRTVAALASLHGKTIAGFSETFAGELMQSAAGDIALADTKKHGASYKDLHIGAGIKMQHAMAVKLVADTGPAPTDITAESERTAALRAKLRALRPVNLATENTEGTEKTKIETAGQPAQPT